MAGTMKTDGMEELSRMLEGLDEKAESIAAAALYEGAGAMRSELVKAAEGIRAEPFRFVRNGTRMPSQEEKNAVLQAAPGIAKFDKNGSEVSTSVGFGKAGYAKIGRETKAVAQIANAINSGTSFMQKQPFFRKGENAGRKKAVAAMTKEMEKRIQEITDGGKNS